MHGRFDFDQLFILEVANNHQGSVEHGLRVISEHAAVARAHGVRAGVKFQFRDLDTFIHPDAVDARSNKHIERFLGTRLAEEEFEKLLSAVRDEGLLAVCTPFDEVSVGRVVDMGFDVIKVASCSSRDWPLLEEIVETSMPIVASTGGLEISDIDDLVSFFDHRGADYALMHCVSLYPIPEDEFDLSNIAMMRRRFPHVPIGWSTHESPEDTLPVTLALAMGAQIFERHIGVSTDDVTLNAYSATPEQMDAWFSAYHRSRRLLGSYERQPPGDEERQAIAELARGVYARSKLASGTELAREDVYFAMPVLDGQLTSGELRDGTKLLDDVAADGAVMRDAAQLPSGPESRTLKDALHEVKALLSEAHVVLDHTFDVEYSHHYGIERFKEVGATFIECVNRDYCKKIVAVLPGQRHPNHYHRRKDETFQVIYGELHVEVGGIHRVMGPGETILVQPGVWHGFWSDTGAVFEEISTTHFNDDSFYHDRRIQRLPREERKTIVDNWGRFQIEGMPGFSPSES